MSELQVVLNNHEIAVGIWVMLAISISIFIKPVR